MPKDTLSDRSSEVSVPSHSSVYLNPDYWEEAKDQEKARREDEREKVRKSYELYKPDPNSELDTSFIEGFAALVAEPDTRTAQKQGKFVYVKEAGKKEGRSFYMNEELERREMADRERRGKGSSSHRGGGGRRDRSRSRDRSSHKPRRRRHSDEYSSHSSDYSDESSQASYEAWQERRRIRKKEERRQRDASRERRHKADRERSSGRSSRREKGESSRAGEGDAPAEGDPPPEEAGGGSEGEAGGGEGGAAGGGPPSGDDGPPSDGDRSHRSRGSSRRGGRKGRSLDSDDDTQTMSSGLSPRDFRGMMRTDLEDPRRGWRALRSAGEDWQRSYVGGPSNRTFHGPDDLPTRLAYEQLNQLAGMSTKVQAAIEHNKKIFERRVRMGDDAIKAKVLKLWSEVNKDKMRRKRLLQRHVRKMKNLQLARAWNKWRDMLPLDPSQRMLKKYISKMAAGIKKRCFFAWFNCCQEIQKDTLEEVRVRRIVKDLEAKFQQRMARRAEMIWRRKRLSALWFFLDEHAGKRRENKNKLYRAIKYFKNAALAKAWNALLAHHERIRVCKRAIQRYRNKSLAGAWNKWYSEVLATQGAEDKLDKAVKFMQNRTLAKAWNSWYYNHMMMRKAKKIALRWTQRHMAAAFGGWAGKVAELRSKRWRAKKAMAYFRNRDLGRGFRTWRENVAYLKSSTAGDRFEAAIKENERLRRDNERFIRLIDSGEWGRGRVEEMVKVGQVLSRERDELSRLMLKLQGELDAVTRQKAGQDQEIRDLKNRILSGNSVLRNKMNVQGGSSYNALTRALKQDLVEGFQQSSRLKTLYAVDKMSLNRVTTFPDGELHVEAVRPEGVAGEPWARSEARSGPSQAQLDRAAIAAAGGAAGVGRGAQYSGGAGRAQSAHPRVGGGAGGGGYSPRALRPSSARGAGPSGIRTGPAAQRMLTNHELVVEHLQNLSPQEVDKLMRTMEEARHMEEARQARNPGLASTH